MRCEIITAKLAQFFLSSFMWGLAFASMRLPPLLGYILSGIILGPSFTKSMGESIAYIKVIGEFGLLMLMFVAGLELDVNEFAGTKNDLLKPVMTVCLQVLCSFAVVLAIWVFPLGIFSNYTGIAIASIALISIVVLLKMVITYVIKTFENTSGRILSGSLISFIMILIGGIRLGILQTNSIFNLQTMSMVSCLLALNSTAITMKLLESRDKKNTLLGTNVIGILVGQDLMLIVMMIVLQSLSTQFSLPSLLLKIGIGFSITYLVKIITTSKPSFISDTLDYIFQTSKELTALFAITLCFTCSAVSEAVGLSDIYGAFIAGLVLGNIYKHNRYIIKICEPISNILMTMFFMWVGAMFDIQELIKYWLPISLISISIVIFKYLSNYYIIKLVHQDNNEFSNSCVILSSILLTQLSEFSLPMIAIIARNLQAADLIGMGVCDMAKSCAITSLSLGAILTVIIKNCLYKYKYIE